MRFADFHLDPVTGELSRNGQPIRIERMPAQLLCLLASRPGQLISRQEIVERLWGPGVFLDTDNGINTAICKIRIALRDDPEKPRFVATLPGRGYRFIAPLLPEPSPAIADPPDTAAAQSPLPHRTTPLPPAPVQLPSPPVPAGLPSATTPSRGWTRAVALAIALLLLIAAALTMLRNRRASVAQHTRSMIAVLPFVNLSGDPAQEYFADGMTEEMIAQLGAMNPAQLGVIARTSAMHYKGSSEDISHIARELGVDYLLEGSVRRAGDDVRVTAQLIRADDQTHLWAQDYDRHLTNVLEMQGAIASAIAQQIRIAIPAARNSAPLNSSAYEAYLRGNQALEQRSPSGMSSAIAELRQAVALDPGYAAAWASLSRAYSLAPVFAVLPSAQALPLARDAALQAIQLDPTSAVAHCTLAFVHAHYEFNWTAAEQEFQRALALNPSDPSTHLFYSNSFLSPQGRHAEAIAEIKKALTLDPLSFPIQSFAGRTLEWAGQPQAAIEQFHRTIQNNPNSALEHVRLARTLSALGRYPEAIAEEERARILAGETPESAVAKSQQLRARLQQQGPEGYWRQELALATLPQNPPEFFTGAYGQALLYAQIGNSGEALRRLHEALTERDLRLTEMAIEPLLTPLNANPDFLSLERTLGLPPSGSPAAPFHAP